MKYSFYLLCAIFTFSGYSQDTIQNSYIPIQHYIKLGKSLTQQDTINFQFKGKDTMVLVTKQFIEERYKNRVRVEYEPKDSLFLEIYKDVVYGRPDSKTRNTEVMKYWKDDIRVYFHPSVPVAHSKYLMEFADEISSDIDSLKISKVTTREESNYIVYYLNPDYKTEHEPRITNNTGGYYVDWKKYQIYNGSLKINTEYAKNEDHQLQLLTHYFLGSLGYFKSSDIIACESYLSSCRNYRKLTQIDREILKYHYSYGICKNVNLEDFEEMHANMQNTLLKDPNAKVYVLH